MVSSHHAVGAAIGAVADAIVGDAPLSPHPVAVYGQTMTRLESLMWRDSRAAGALYAAVGVGLPLLAALPARRRPVAATAAATFVAVAGRGLWDAARAVAGPLNAGNLGLARERLPALVGRDPSGLGEKEIARAVVESVAENTVDAIVAPLCWAAVAGAPGVVAHRASNTLDAMVGHRNARYGRFGWASARLDDVLAYAPARLTAALVAGVTPFRAKEILRTVAMDAHRHPSPNAGVAESAFASALGLALGGESTYEGRTEMRPQLGDGRPPEAADIDRAIRLSQTVTAAAVVVLAAGVAAGEAVARRTAKR